MHQCVHCGKFYPDGSKELLEGCSSCHSRFFFYVRDATYEKLKQEEKFAIELKKEDKVVIEKDIREMIGLEEEKPVILDLESIRILSPGKFEIDISKLMRNKNQVIYKLEEGKYIVDIASLFEATSKKRVIE
jgi:uncharacterized protein